MKNDTPNCAEILEFYAEKSTTNSLVSDKHYYS